MSYRIRWEIREATGLRSETYATREAAHKAIDERIKIPGLAYTVEEVPDAPEPGSTAAHHVEILRARVKELEAVQKAMSHDLSFAIQIGDAMREAMRHGAWGHDGEGHLASVSAGSWDRFKTSLAKAPSVPVGASEVPGEGGDSDRRRLEALERWLRGNTYRMVYFSSRGVIVAGSDSIGDDDMEAPTLAALADKLAEMEDKP